MAELWTINNGTDWFSHAIGSGIFRADNLDLRVEFVSTYLTCSPVKS